MTSIGIDCRLGSSLTGIGSYIRGLVPHLVSELSAHHCVLFVRDTSEEWLQDIQDGVTLLQTDIPHYSLREQIAFPRRISQARLDLFFTPHFNVPFLCTTPFVVTIHDLILHRYPNTASLPKQLAYRLLMKRSVRRARKIIAVSEFTKNELSSVYGKNTHQKTSVVTEGVDPLFMKIEDSQSERVLKQYNLLPGFFLYVGNAKEHKNVQALIDAHRSIPDLAPLVLVTSGKESTKLTLHEGVSLIEKVRHSDLPVFYSAAICFVTASLYEGFCLPIVEARACKCPIIASNEAAIPEVAGGHALLIEPNIDLLASALKNPPKTADPPGDRFDWRYAAKQTADMLTSSL